MPQHRRRQDAEIAAVADQPFVQRARYGQWRIVQRHNAFELAFHKAQLNFGLTFGSQG